MSASGAPVLFVSVMTTGNDWFIATSLIGAMVIFVANLSTLYVVLAALPRITPGSPSYSTVTTYSSAEYASSCGYVSLVNVIE